MRVKFTPAWFRPSFSKGSNVSIYISTGVINENSLASLFVKVRDCTSHQLGIVTVHMLIGVNGKFSYFLMFAHFLYFPPKYTITKKKTSNIKCRWPLGKNYMLVIFLNYFISEKMTDIVGSSKTWNVPICTRRHTGCFTNSGFFKTLITFCWKEIDVQFFCIIKRTFGHLKNLYHF